MRKRITKRIVDSLEANNGKPVFLWDSELAGFGVKALPSGRKVYLLQYRLAGNSWKKAPKRFTIGAHGSLTPEQARRRASELLVQVAAGVDPRTLKQKEEETKEPTVTDVAERFLTEYLPGKKRPPRAKTLKEYERLFRRKVLPHLGQRPVATIEENDIERLHGSMRETPYQANRVLEVLLQAFEQTERWGWRPRASNPASYIEAYPEARRGAKKAVMLTSKQMAKLLQAIQDEEDNSGNVFACAAIRVTFWTGWRIGEVLALEWGNLDLEHGQARLLKTKTADEEYRQLPHEAILVLREVPRIAGCPFVFPGKKAGTHLTTVKRPWEAAREAAGLDDLDGLGALRLHDLRHNVVSWDVSRGVPLEIAGKNVGHRSRQSTEVYAHFAPDALKKAADDRARAMREAVEGVA